MFGAVLRAWPESLLEAMLKRIPRPDEFKVSPISYRQGLFRFGWHGIFWIGLVPLFWAFCRSSIGFGPRYDFRSRRGPRPRSWKSCILQQLCRVRVIKSPRQDLCRGKLLKNEKKKKRAACNNRRWGFFSRSTSRRIVAGEKGQCIKCVRPKDAKNPVAGSVVVA